MELRETSEVNNDAFSLHQAFFEKIAQKAFLIIGVLAAVIIALLLLRKLGIFDPQRLGSFVQGAGGAGPIVLVCVILIGSLALAIPASLAIVMSSVLYGLWLGALYAYIAILLSASVAFFISRFFRKPILRLLGSHAEVLVRFQEKYVSYVIFATRIIPIFHFEVVSYAAGITSVTYSSYIVATAAGSIIPLAIFTLTGSLVAEAAGWLPIAAACLLVLAIFIVPLAIDHYNPWGWKDKLLHDRTR